jgi:hypothetical protein
MDAAASALRDAAGAPLAAAAAAAAASPSAALGDAPAAHPLPPLAPAHAALFHALPPALRDVFAAALEEAMGPRGGRAAGGGGEGEEGGEGEGAGGGGEGAAGGSGGGKRARGSGGGGGAEGLALASRASTLLGWAAEEGTAGAEVAGEAVLGALRNAGGFLGGILSGVVRAAQ